MPGMEALYTKREELRAQIKAIEADIRTIERAIEMCGGSLGPVRIFKRGQLKRLVCEAMREGVTGNREIARKVIARMGWKCTDERLRDITARVKDVTKTFR